MPRLRAVLLLLACAAPAVRAGPREEAIVAAMRLSDAPNYSWVATVADDARTYDIKGRTSREGFSRVRMPVVNTVRRRLGRSVTDTEIEFLFLGNVACVLLTEQGWRRPDELDPLPEETDYVPINNPSRSSGIPGVRSIGGGMIKGVPIKPLPPPRVPADDERQRNYSNLQLGLSRPHEELGVIVGSHDRFEVTDGVATGSLQESGARLLLVRDGQKEITPLQAAGTFKLWLRDGAVARYQVRLEGILQVDTPTGRRRVAVTQTTDTVVTEIGTTAFEVPEQARLKLVR